MNAAKAHRAGRPNQGIVRARMRCAHQQDDHMHGRAPSSRVLSSCAALGALAAAALVALAVPRAVGAQMPTVAVLQNGFGGSGVTLALNYGSASGGSAYAVAAAWGPASRRFQVSGALGGVRPDSGSTWAAYGARVSVPVYLSVSERLGAALFAGVGGARRDTTSIVRIPIGVSAGFRQPLGATRSVSAYASPFFVWSRVSEKGARAEGANGLRGSVGADLVITRNVGLTAGYEFGSKADVDAPGAASGIFGVAVSYAFR